MVPADSELRERAIAEEQERIDVLYAALDRLRERIAERLATLFRQHGGTHQAVWEREAFVSRDVDRLTRLSAVEPGLCFGRLDLRDDSRMYIGRIALADDDYEPLLIDWRAPAAAPFYRATAANPGDVVRRRHIRTSRRRVTAVDDEVLGGGADVDRATLTGEAALLASLEADRTGRMSDIVATIQAEQDRVIRSGLAGVLVVQGGPGTGKTVAALHRAAYLLYTHRDRLTERGVLVVGPNPTFLRYIEQVLPSLGETGVVFSSLGGLYPGVLTTAEDTEEAADVKGDLRMADVLAAAVRDRQRVPEDAVELTIDGITLRLDRQTCVDARTRARRSRRPHNRARAVFVREVLTALAGRYAGRLGYGEVLDPADAASVRAGIAAEPVVQKVLDDLWPLVTPERLLSDLYRDPGRIRRLSKSERAAITRPGCDDESRWTVADVPLLDEAAELLGEAAAGPDEAALRAEADREAELAFAQEVLEELELDLPVDPALVADRYHGPPARSTTAQRASSDRTWAFGHVIVDEAQELSPMAWRMVMRRCPARSMTLVGDIAQTHSVAGAGSWEAALDPYVNDRWRQATLEINYRTPAEIMQVAAAVLAEVDPALKPPRSVRSTGVPPWVAEVGDLAGALPEILADELENLGAGKLAVIVPAGRASELADILASGGAGVARGRDPAALDSPAVVLTVTEAKGLEFDSVLVVEPAGIVEGSSRGLRDLYVAVTRATKRLGVVHSGVLPAPLRPLHPRDRR